MVSLMADGVASVKIIDLGLAKMLADQENTRPRYINADFNDDDAEQFVEAKPTSVPICTH